MAHGLGNQNPIRYRGYIYAAEIKQYYLQNRYYMPEYCRFYIMDNYASFALGGNQFAYCASAPVRLRDANGHAFENADAIPENDALSVTVTPNGLDITVYLTITGDIDESIVVEGIMDYWNSQLVDSNGNVYNISTEVIVGSSPDGNSILVETSEGAGVTGTICTLYPISWVPGYSKVSLYRKYSDGRSKTDDDLKWSIAHEFGHVLGIGDYYALDDHDPGFQSIMNGRNMKVSLADFFQVLCATVMKTWTTWEHYIIKKS